MTQEAIEMKKLEHAEALQKEKLAHESREKRKDRIAHVITGGFGDVGKTVATIAKAAAANDPSFYFNSEELNNYCSVNTRVRTGADNLIGSGCQNQALPGVCILHTINVPPVCGTVNDPINSAFRTEYKIVRGRQYGDVAYSYADMAQMLICMADIYAAYYWLRRTYGLVTAHEIPENQYWTSAILRAEGWEVEQLFGPNGRMQLFDVIDRLTKTMSAWVAPGGFNYFARAIVQYGGVYKDTLGEEGQYYLRTPYAFYHYDVVDSRAELQTISHSQMNVSYIATVINSMISSLYTVPSFNKMQSEMQMAYADSSWTVEPMSFDYTIIPVYDEYALSMFANATYPGSSFLNFSNLHITQNTEVGSLNYGALEFKPAIFLNSDRVTSHPSIKALMRADSDTRYLYFDGEITPEKVIEAIQMAYFLGNERVESDGVYRDIVGNSCTMVMDAKVATYSGGYLTQYGLNIDAIDGSAAQCCWSAFAYAPVIHLVFTAGATDKYWTLSKPNKVTTFTGSKMKQISEQSAFTLFSAKGSRVDKDQRRSNNDSYRRDNSNRKDKSGK